MKSRDIELQCAFDQFLEDTVLRDLVVTSMKNHWIIPIYISSNYYFFPVLRTLNWKMYYTSPVSS